MPRITSKSFLNVNASRLTLSKGSVTQITSLATAVTCNASAGYITTVNTTLAANDSTTFKVNNSHVSADSCVVANISNYAGTTGIPVITVDDVKAGEFSITVTNVNDAAALNNTIKISFIVV